jgi:hypothetical protein
MADGILKVGTITTSSGSGTITLGQSGETVTIPTGATITNSGTATGFGGTNTPAFAVNIDAHQTISSATDTIIAMNQETLDTAGAFNLSNYRFTPQVAGKYAIYLTMVAFADANSRLQTTMCGIRKNGSNLENHLAQAEVDSSSNNGKKMAVNSHAIVTLNGSSDYVDFLAYVIVSSGVAKLHVDMTSAMGFKLTE